MTKKKRSTTKRAPAKAKPSARGPIPAEVSRCASALGRAGAAKRWAGHVKAPKASKGARARASGAAAVASVKPMVAAPSYAVSRELQQAMQRPDMVKRALTMRDAIRSRSAEGVLPIGPPVERARQVPAGVAFALGQRWVVGDGRVVPDWLVRLPARAGYTAPWGKELWLFDNEKPGFDSIAPAALVQLRGNAEILVYRRPVVGASIPTLEEGPSGDAEIYLRDYFDALANAPLSSIVRGRIVSVDLFPGTERPRSFVVRTPSGSRAKISWDYEGQSPLPAWVEPQTPKALATRDDPFAPQQEAEQQYPGWAARKREAIERREAGDAARNILLRAARSDVLTEGGEFDAQELATALAASWGARIERGADPIKTPIMRNIRAIAYGVLPGLVDGAGVGAPREFGDALMVWILRTAGESIELTAPVLHEQARGASEKLDRMRADLEALRKWIRGTNFTNVKKRLESCCASCASCASGGACESEAKPAKGKRATPKAAKAAKTPAPYAVSQELREAMQRPDVVARAAAMRNASKAIARGARSWPPSGVSVASSRPRNPGPPRPSAPPEDDFDADQLAELERMFDFMGVKKTKRAQILEACRLAISRGGSAEVSLYGTAPDPLTGEAVSHSHTSVFVDGLGRRLGEQRGVYGVEQLWSVSGLSARVEIPGGSSSTREEDASTLGALGLRVESDLLNGRPLTVGRVGVTRAMRLRDGPSYKRGVGSHPSTVWWM